MPGIRKCAGKAKRREQETHSELQQRFLRVSSNAPAKSGLVPINNDEGMFFFPPLNKKIKKLKNIKGHCCCFYGGGSLFHGAQQEENKADDSWRRSLFSADQVG